LYSRNTFDQIWLADPIDHAEFSVCGAARAQAMILTAASCLPKNRRRCLNHASVVRIEIALIITIHILNPFLLRPESSGEEFAVIHSYDS
jgi:hypothetical protein